MRKQKMLSFVLTLCILLTTLFTTMVFPKVEADEYKTVYVSNKYGNDSNDGLSASTALKTIKAAVNKIGTSNDGTVIVLDGLDSNGNREYSVYTRYSGSSPYKYGPDKVTSITQDVLIYDAPAHTGTITYEGDASDSVIASGANHLELAGPTVFKNISYIEGWNIGKNLVTRGHDFRMEGKVYQIRVDTADSTGGVVNGGLISPRDYFDIDVVGRGNITTAGTLTLAAGEVHSVVGIGGWSGTYTISAPQTVVVNGANITTGIGISGSSGCVNKFDIINVVYNSGTVGKIYDRESTACTAKAVQVICNNGMTVTNTSTVVGTLGNWNMNCAAVEGSSLYVTDTAGTFTVLGEKTAVASGNNGSFSSENGVLTVPAGTYSVSFVDAVETITVKFDGVADENEYYKGSDIVLPDFEDTETKEFIGWTLGGTSYNGGATITLPTDVDEVNFVSVWRDIAPAITVYLDLTNGSDSNTGLSADAPFKTLEKAFSTVDASRSPEKTVVLSGPMDINNSLPAHTNMITIMGDGKEGTELRIVQNSISMEGPITFKNIHFNVVTTATKFLNPGNHTLLFLDGVTSGGNQTLNVHYGASNSNGPKQTITISGGNFGTVYVGSYYTVGDKVTAGADITINGGTIQNMALRADGYAANHTGVIFSEDVNITVNGGTITNFITHSTYGAKFQKNLTFLFNNGTSCSNIANYQVDGGKWIVNSAATAGCKLEISGTAGKFNVIGGKIAIARNADGEAYCSENAVLTIPAGTWTVTYVDSIDDAVISVKYDGVDDGLTHIKGSTLVLPTLPDKFESSFEGWDLGGTKYAAGDKVILSEDANEISFTSVWKAIPDVAVAYVSDAGNDNNTGATADSPFATYDKAFAAVDSADATTRLVIVIGSMDIDIKLPTHTNMITMRGDGSGDSQLCFIKNSVSTNGPITFEYIDFDVQIASKFFDPEDAEIIFGEGITVSSTQKISAHFGTQNQSGGKQKVTINSGAYSYLYLGACYNSDIRTTAGADVVINGGTITRFSIGSDGWLSTHCGVVFTDNVNITVNGGTISEFATRSENMKASFEKALTFVFNNGTSCPSIADFEAAGGVWKLYSADKSGNALKPTENAGEFEVVGGLTAIATTSTNEQYISASGILKVPAGTYDITYTEKVYYTNTGLEVEFLSDYEIDLTTLRHSIIENKLFIGWADENGNGVTKSNFTTGEKLYAKFVDCDLSEGGDFAIKGVQIRTSGVHGLRFIIEKSDDITDDLNASEYGAVIIPSKVLGTKDVELGGKYTYEGKTYTVGSVVAENTFKDYGEKIDYTLCLIGLGKAQYTTLYRVRGYIKYTDLQGNDQILYTNYYASNLYTVAKAALADTETNYSEDEIAYFTSIKNYVDETMKQEYLSQTKTDIVGTSANPETWIYRLGENGVYVREFELDSGKGGDAVEIVQISDTHFNYCNERDFEEAYPETMSTWENRYAFKYPSTQNALDNSIEYASYSDQIIVTGDAIDYLSWGCLELLYKYVWDPHPDTLIPFGNHEVVRRMQGNVAESTSLDSRLALLAENWKHDIYYESKVLSNEEGTEKVMVVAINNCLNYFFDGQAEKLAADIEICREKDIPMLVFMHIPLLTRNPADYDVPALRVNDSSVTSRNFYNEGDYIGFKGGASKDVYDVITKNPDVIKGIFNGHMHSDFYTEIWSKNADGTDNPDVTIPQYTLTGSAYETGHALRITVK